MSINFRVCFYSLNITIDYDRLNLSHLYRVIDSESIQPIGHSHAGDQWFLSHNEPLSVIKGIEVRNKHKYRLIWMHFSPKQFYKAMDNLPECYSVYHVRKRTVPMLSSYRSSENYVYSHVKLIYKLILKTFPTFDFNMITYLNHIITFKIFFSSEYLASNRVQSIITGVHVFFEDLSLE